MSILKTAFEMPFRRGRWEQFEVLSPSWIILNKHCSKFNIYEEHANVHTRLYSSKILDNIICFQSINIMLDDNNRYKIPKSIRSHLAKIFAIQKYSSISSAAWLLQRASPPNYYNSEQLVSLISFWQIQILTAAD